MTDVGAEVHEAVCKVDDRLLVGVSVFIPTKMVAVALHVVAGSMAVIVYVPGFVSMVFARVEVKAGPVHEYDNVPNV